MKPQKGWKFPGMAWIKLHLKCHLPALMRQ